MLKELLFEEPLWGIVAGLLIAVMALFRWTRSRAKVDLRVALVGLAVAVLFYVTDLAVTTDRERISELSLELVRATAPAPVDADAMRALLTEDFAIVWADGSVWLEGDVAVARAVEEAASRGLSHASIAIWEAEVVSPSQGVTHVHLRTNYAGRDVAQRFVTTDWRITWRKEADGRWRASEAQWLEFFGRPVGRGFAR